MKLFLIRHGETVHNVAGLLAGVTDSDLTNHGMLQAQRLGSYLINTLNLTFTNLYASDLKRAWMTAQEIEKAQGLRQSRQKKSLFSSSSTLASERKVEVVQTPLLREQDFGSLELVSWSSKRMEDPHPLDPPDPDYTPKETPEAMRARADEFIDSFLQPLLANVTTNSSSTDPDGQVVAIVSHGLFLGTLWRALLSRFSVSNVKLSPEVAAMAGDRPIEHLGGWVNTGFLELSILPGPSGTTSSGGGVVDGVKGTNGTSVCEELTLTVLTMNGKAHLTNLKRTGGGVGSAKYDVKQQGIRGFFGK